MIYMLLKGGKQRTQKPDFAQTRQKLQGVFVQKANNGGVVHRGAKMKKALLWYMSMVNAQNK
jgi:hypothetical protein